ncbi:SHOCT domain-containing protein [Streptomyces sp. NPDC050400]|uniref:SHOCT domain-containing protein n=1 Tax=Streptomyces sp. NPDC050400 TaxID=3365610 RepID=UPI0037978104
MYGNWGHDISTWGYVWLTASTVVFWGVIGLVAFAAVRAVSRGPGRSRESVAQPERLLAERFARGELDDDEYRRRIAVLRDNAPLTKGG